MESNRKLPPLDLFILKFFYLWLLFDSINGFFIRTNVGLPVSIIYKSALLFFLSLRLLKFNLGSRILIYITVYIVCQSLYYYVINLEKIAESFQLFLKPLTNILIFVYMYHLLRLYGDVCLHWIKKIFKYNFIIFALNIYSGIFGFGFRSYESDFGSLGFCGYFYSINELGGVCMAIFPFILYILQQRGKKYFVLGSLIILCLGLLIISKAAIASALFSVFYIYCYKPKHKRAIIFLLIFFILYLGLTFDINNFLSGDVAYLQKAIYAYNKGGVVELLLSSRQTFVEQRTAIFFNAPFFTQLFGVGGNRTVEMDIFDVLLNIGYMGIFIYLSLWAYLFIKLKQNKRNNDFIKIIFASDFVLLGMSLFAGHIYFSSTAGLFIAMLNSLMFYKQNNEKKEKDSRYLQPISF